MQPLTILHLTHEGRGAGSSVSIALLAQAQLGAGHMVLAACPDGYLAERLRAAGVRWSPLDFSSISRAARAIACLADGGGVHIVNAHSSRDRAACRRLRFRGRLEAALVMTRRAMPRSTPVTAVADGLAADRVIAVSHAVARSLRKRGIPSSRISVVHNALDLQRIDRPVSEKPAVGGGQSAVVGVVSRRKDHETLFRAMKLLRVPAMLVSLGFEASARERVENPGVVFLPFVDDPRPYYDAFDVVVLPTKEEGLSQGVMEAMALAKPVVTTDIPSNRELISHGEDGLLVPAGHPAAMASAIDKLLTDRGLAARLGATASLRVRQTFTIDQTLAATDSAYRAAMARRGAA